MTPWRTGALAVLLVALPAAPGLARSVAAQNRALDEAEARPGGAAALVASAAYPGLGQLLNGAEPKAAIVSAVEAFLVAGLIVEDRRTRNSFRLYQETGKLEHYEDYSQHFDNRQTLVWWVVVAALYGIADAYVDAHLADFDEPTPPHLEGAFGRSSDGAGELRVALAVRF